MKKILQRWLDVPRVKDILEYDRQIIRNEVSSAIAQAFDLKVMAEFKFKYKFGYGLDEYKVNLAHVVGKKVDEALEERVLEAIKGEAFIDHVVARIKKKQLGE